jgi:hypothetical protein
MIRHPIKFGLLGLFLCIFISETALAQQVLRAEKRAFSAPSEEGIPKSLEAPGLIYKGFSYYPSMKVSSTYISNVYAQETNEIEDIVLKVSPAIRITKEYKKLQLASDLRVIAERYNELKEENKEDVHFSLAGDYEISSKWNIPLRIKSSVISRDRGEPLSQSATREPLRIKQFSASSGISKRFNHLILSLIGGYDKTQFADGTSLLDGDDVVYRDNDRTAYTGQVGARYEFIRGSGGDVEHIVFSNMHYKSNQFKRRDFVGGSFSGLSRDNTEIAGFIGLETSYKDLLFANIGVGYFINDYEEASLDNVDGLALDAKIEYALSPKWQVGLDLGREVSQDNDLLQGEVKTSFRLFSEYEVYSRLYLDGAYAYNQFDVGQTGREDEENRYNFGVLYLLNQNLRARVGLSYTNYESNIEDSSFQSSSAIFSLIGKL